MKKVLFALLLAAPLIATADTDYRDLLMTAMHAKDGKTSVELTGRVAEMIRAQINRPNAKVIADVTTIAELKQEGCKRFNIRFTTPGTLLPMTDGQSRMLDMSMKLNMCQNGFPPGIENEQELVEQALKSEQKGAFTPDQPVSQKKKKR